MKLYRKIYNIGIFLFTAIVMLGCGDKEVPETPQKPDEPVEPKEGICVLFYDVCSEGSMATNYYSDRAEIITAAPNLDLENNTFLFYSVLPMSHSDKATLEKLVKDADGTYTFQVVKEFDRETYSTDPKRLAEVLDIMQTSYKADHYGYIMGAHGTGWSPGYGVHERDEEMKAIGGDTNDGSTYDWLDIDELANVIPDGLFDYIWFDACYMSTVENAYQLRRKCDYLVAYPTEIYIPGMPYDETLPLLVKADADLIGAATLTYDYYNNQKKAVTIAVMDMGKMEALAAAASRMYAADAEGVFTPLKTPYGLLKYTRGSVGPFYDFGQYTRNVAANNGVAQEDADAFAKALNDVIVYKAASEKDFNYSVIPAENYSGLSCHLYKHDMDNEAEDFYRTLDWYNATYKLTIKQ